MKSIQGLLLLAAAAMSANASIITFNSTSTANDMRQSNSMGANIIIQKNPAWVDPLSGSQWISYTNTGDPASAGYTTVPNGTVVSFFQNFNLLSTDLSVNGVVSLYADDSSSVVLNGHTLVNEASGAGNNYGTCSDTTPNCRTVTTVVLPKSFLVAGTNTLQFDVAQRAGSSFGLDYSGAAGAAAPEPATWTFLASGALALSLTLRKRVKA